MFSFNYVKSSINLRNQVKIRYINHNAETVYSAGHKAPENVVANSNNLWKPKRLQNQFSKRSSESHIFPEMHGVRYMPILISDLTYSLTSLVNTRDTTSNKSKKVSLLTPQRGKKGNIKQPKIERNHHRRCIDLKGHSMTFIKTEHAFNYVHILDISRDHIDCFTVFVFFPSFMIVWFNSHKPFSSQ